MSQHDGPLPPATFEDAADVLEAVVDGIEADPELRAAVDRLPPGPKLDAALSEAEVFSWPDITLSGNDFSQPTPSKRPFWTNGDMWRLAWILRCHELRNKEAAT